MPRFHFISCINSLKSHCILGCLAAVFLLPLQAEEEPFLDKQVLFEEKTDGYSIYRIPGMAGIIAHPGSDGVLGSVLLFSNPHTTKRKHSARRDVTTKLSRDGGLTWPVQKTLEDGPSAYSDLAVLPDGTILCFYESGVDPPKVERNRDWAYANITLARFNLEWLTR